ncbi:MAG TPA: hypothetical protein VK123_04780 [Candidatus Limnocylindrales bacterium]|nr:hypothetical protein [Candidatus Limnocylindrales bacterium]
MTRGRLGLASFALTSALAMALAAPQPAAAQQVLMDRGLRAAGLWVFPLASDSLQYVYLPASARLATDDQGRPQFSFVRYVITAPGDSARAATITEAKGGGILHFLVLMDTPQSLIDDAQKSLRQKYKKDEITIRGPIIFSDGRYTLVSSIIKGGPGVAVASADGGSSDEGGGKAERTVIATGRAPVLEGNRLALSFDLDPEHASLLLQSFQMNTPDVSLVFDMTFSGLSEAYDADLTIDWSEMKHSQTFKAGGTVYFVSADVEVGLDELMKNHTIKLRSSGSDASMEGLLNTVYSKLLDLMFRPVEPERVPPDQSGGLMQALSQLGNANGPMGARKTVGFGASVGYQLKDMRTEGQSHLTFNHRSSVERHSFVTFNIGDFHKRYGQDNRYFRAVNLGDPTFQQREVHVAVDAALVPDFDRYVNTITVTLRKDHQNGEQTLREIVLDRATVKKGVEDLRMVYGWNGDQDRLAWLDYQYRTRWSFKGGGTYETEWTHTSAPMIDLFAPYEHRTVQLVGDGATLKSKGVRAVIVQLDYPFFGERRRPQMVVRPEEAIEDKQVEITLPLGQPDYDYLVTWQMEGNKRLTDKRRDSSGLVFVDELP